MWGRVFCKKKMVLQWKSTHNHVGGFCNKIYKNVFILRLFLHLCYKSIFSELGHMLLHPSHDSAKSSPNVRLSFPIQYCLYRYSLLVFFFTMRNLGPSCISRNFLLSRIDTRRWDLFFGGYQNYPNNIFLFHFVLQTAHSTAHNRFTLFDASGRPQRTRKPGRPWFPSISSSSDRQRTRVRLLQERQNETVKCW